jgi:hypothetical protein
LLGRTDEGKRFLDVRSECFAAITASVVLAAGAPVNTIADTTNSNNAANGRMLTPYKLHKRRATQLSRDRLQTYWLRFYARIGRKVNKRFCERAYRPVGTVFSLKGKPRAPPNERTTNSV